jgi:hypothetical protein
LAVSREFSGSRAGMEERAPRRGVDPRMQRNLGFTKVPARGLLKIGRNGGLG